MRHRVILVGMAAVLALAGCELGPMSDGGKGTVENCWTAESRHGNTYYECRVRPAPGYGTEDSTGRVSHETYRKCDRKGAPWPACKN
jgi:glycerate kinase